MAERLSRPHARYPPRRRVLTRPDVSGVIRWLSSFSFATHVCAGCEMDIGTSKADQLRCSQARLGGEACEERVVSPPGPGRPIGSGKQRSDFRLSQEGHQLSVEALGRDGENGAR